MGKIQHDFDTWESFVRFAAEDVPRWNNGNGAQHSRDTKTPSWYGSKNFAQAVELALHGWKEGREQIVDGLMKTAPNAFAMQRGETHDVAGAYPDIQAAIAGDPASMIDLGDQHVAAKPVVRIVSEVGVNASITSEAIINNGVALLSCVNDLEEQGYSVELSVHSGTKTASWKLDFTAVFKRAGDPLDIDRAAFALAHPSVLRRFDFSIMERHPELGQSGEFGGYGRPDKFDEDELQGRIQAPAADNSCSDLDNAIARMRKVFGEYLK